jgi:hypothetical protein
MGCVADPESLQGLETRLMGLRPDSQWRWGSLTPAEVLCHLGDACASVLSRPGGAPGPRRALRKWIALRSPLPWPRGARTPDGVNPRAGGTRPTDFESDRRRAIEGLRAVADASAEALPAAHFLFGAMSAEDWKLWAHRHTDHHLRQFGL